MSTPSRRLSPSRCRVSGTTVTDRVAASSEGRSAVESVTMATERLLKPANDSPEVSGLGSNLGRWRRVGVPALLVLEEPPLDRPHDDEDHDHKDGCEGRDGVVTKADGHAQRRSDPYLRCRGHASNVATLAKDRARADEAYTSHDLRRDPRRIDAHAKRRLQSKSREHASACGD